MDIGVPIHADWYPVHWNTRIISAILPSMYKHTIRACYAGTFTMSLVSNLTPLLFVILMDSFGLTFEQVGRLTLVNFMTQIAADLVFSKPVDKWGVRPFVAGGHFLCTIGLVLFALAPMYAPHNTYIWFMVSTVLFSCGGGLLELLLSPIVQAIPGDEKARAMSMLHSFYAWGFILVVVLTTTALGVFGSANWPLIMITWAILPLATGIAFLKVPLAPQVSEEQRTRTGVLLSSAFFVVVVLGIAAGGAAEVSMSQWISAFTERALGLSKQMGDLVGVCMFALFLGIGRASYGKWGGKTDVTTLMLWGAVGSVLCFLGAALIPNPILAMACCAANGLCVSLLWPGSIVTAAARFPLAGASMFAILAAGGDVGAAFGPWAVGAVADVVPSGLRGGLLVGTIYPAIMVVCMLVVRAMNRRGAVQSINN